MEKGQGTKFMTRKGNKSMGAMRGLAALAGAAGLLFAGLLAANQAVAKSKYEVDGRKSGYLYSNPETNEMQDDDFLNPGMLWVQRGIALWSKVDGAAGKSCASCHGEDAKKSMRGVFTVYPKINKKTGKLENIEQRINRCRVENMKAKPWKWESDELLSMTTFIGYLSRGLPMNVKVDGEVKPFFEKGKAEYFKRRGQLDMACKHCHIDNPGKHIRADLLSEGRAGQAFPLYRLKWQKIGSLHRRFRGCNKQVRAKPYKPGAEEYVNLELYVKWRSRGLPVEVPAVRR